MDPLLPPEIEDYAAAHTDPPGPLYEELAEATRERTDDPQMQVGPVEGALLKMLVQLCGARRVLEIGMFTGYSGLKMAEGLPEGGELITCEIDPDAEAIAREFHGKSPHGKKITVRMGPALETIATLQGPLDLVFIDADKEHYPEYYDAVLPLVRSGGLIVADNTLWSGRVLQPRRKTDLAIVAFNDKVARDDRVEKVLLTVRDGILIARKK
ncbi:MAG TPA: class I SAM-dependent methyltransferase [Myxococcales bacterium]|nr:class I SAM-dependent methyltransferase [Myxococcales bacterium]